MPVIVKITIWRRWKTVLTGVYLVLGLAGQYSWIDWKSSAFIVGALALFYTPVFSRQPTGSFRFGWIMLFFSMVFIFLPVKTILYFVFISAALLFRENFYRRVEYSVPVILLLMTPVSEYFARLFGFPIRLQLTVLAGRILQLTGQPIIVAGNLLTYRGHTFSVDPACMGLHMVVASILLAFLLMNVYQSRYNRRLPVAVMLLLLVVVITLNVIANLVRISSLVLLMILPDNPMHGLLGLLVLGVYVLLPLIPLVRLLTSYWGRPVEGAAARGVEGLAERGAEGLAAPGVGKSAARRAEEKAGGEKRRPVRRKGVLIGNGLAVACLTLVVGGSLLKERQPVAPWPDDHPIAGYTVKRLPGAVLQLDNGRSLVYIKPIPDFYYTEHSPIICWEGSGYQFGQVQQRLLKGIVLYEGLLQKGNESLYTAWWYDNGLRQTAGTLDWRWDVLRGGRPYSIINVTAASPRLLEEEVEDLLATHPFRQLLAAQGEH